MFFCICINAKRGQTLEIFSAYLAQNRDNVISVLRKSYAMTNGQVAEILGVATSSAVTKATGDCGQNWVSRLRSVPG